MTAPVALAEPLNSRDLPSASTLTDSAQIIIQGDSNTMPLLGTRAAKVVVNPLLTQNTRGMTDFTKTVTSFERPAVDVSEDKLGFILSDATVHEILSEAIYGPVSAETFKKLEQVCKMAKVLNRHSELHRLYRLAYGFACFHDGRIAAALNSLNVFESSHDPCDALTVIALTTKADILMGCGVITEGKNREDAFKQACELLKTRLPSLVARASGLTPELREILAETCLHATDFFMRYRYTESALDVAEVIFKTFSDTTAYGKLIAKDSPIAPFLIQDSGEVKIARTVPSDTPLWTRLWAGAREFVNNAYFPRKGLFWKTAIAGGMKGMIGAAILTGGQPDFGTLLAGMAVGGTSAVAVGKTYFGVRAPETGQAYHMGYSRLTKDDFYSSVLGHSLRLLGTYALCGGALPGAEVLPDVLLSHSYGDGFASLPGLGGLMATVTDTSLRYGNDALQLMQSFGVKEGGDIFWHNLRATTIAGSSFGHGVDMVSGAVNAVVNGVATVFAHVTHTDLLKQDALTLWNNVAAYFATLGDPTALVGNLGVAYATVGASYALLMMARPDLRKKLLLEHPDALLKFELAVMPAAYLAAYKLGIAAGQKQFDAFLTPLICYAAALRVHKMGGGTLAPKNINWANLMIQGGIQLLYVAPGRALRSDIKPVTLTDYYMEHISMVGFLIMVGVVHSAVINYRMGSVLEAKIVKAPTYEPIAGMAKLMAGWDTALAIFLGIFLKELGLGPATTVSYRENSGSVPQYTSMLELFGRANKAKGPEVASLAAKIFDSITLAGRLWEFSNPLTGQSLTQMAVPFTALYYSLNKNGDPPFPTQPDKVFWRTVIFRFLMEKGTREQELNGLLTAAEYILNQEGQQRADVRHNLLVCLWAARNGPYGDTVRAFLLRNKALLRQEGLFKHVEPPRSWQGFAARQFFANQLRSSFVSADGISRVASLDELASFPLG